MARRPRIALAAMAVLALVVAAVPVLAGQPSGPPGQQKEKVEKNPISLNGTIESSTDADGETSYTLTDGGTKYTLEAGPKWFFGDAYPLKQYVGQNVRLEGEVAAGSTEVDVISVNGTALRGEGKPPWAGGWKRVGASHPGWSQQKADRFEAKFGDCFPPGQCKDKPGKAGEPKESEAPGPD